MKKIAAFVYMDFQTFKPYLKNTAFIAAMGVLFGFLLKATLMPMLMAMLGVILTASYPFAISEKNGMASLYKTLPLKTASLVVGRYAFALLSLIAAMVAAFVCSLIVDAVYSGEGAAAVAAQFSAFASLSVFVLALQYPIYFRFGYTKAKTAAMIPVLLFSLGIALIGTLSPEISKNALSFISGRLAAALFPVAALVSYCISTFISVKLYENKKSD